MRRSSKTAKLNLQYTDIISPVDGTVVSRAVAQGQTVASSLHTPTLFLIGTNLKTLEVDTNVSESDVGGMKAGDPTTFTVDAYPNRTFQGTIAQVRLNPQTAHNVVTYYAVVNVKNDDLLALKPGMTASTQIILSQRNMCCACRIKRCATLLAGSPGHLWWPGHRRFGFCATTRRLRSPLRQPSSSSSGTARPSRCVVKSGGNALASGDGRR